MKINKYMNTTIIKIVNFSKTQKMYTQVKRIYTLVLY